MDENKKKRNFGEPLQQLAVKMMITNILRILTLLIIFNIGLVTAKVTQSIDRQQISAGETFVLDIQVDDNSDSSPDLSMIPQDFTIVSNSQYQHTQIINGKRSSIKGWKLKLKTLKSGKITIPAIPVGNQATRPIQLNIKDSSFQVELNGQNKAIFLTAEVDEAAPYVQQQVILTVSLYRSVATHYENLSAPVVENSVVEKLGDDVVFDKTVDNKNYSVYQRKYVIFPQQSGEIEIGAVNFTADVNDTKRNRGGFFLNSTRPISISTKPVKLNVKAKPSIAGNPWLPAESLILADRWSNNSEQLTVGEPITWTLLLTVQGLSESQIPELQLPTIEGLQVYPDTPQKERQVNAKGLLGQRIEKFAVIPSKEGQITIPEFKLNWWNTKTNTKETATLPAKTFMVKAAANTPAPQKELPTVNQSDINSSDKNQSVFHWQIISAAIFLLWLITLFAYFKKTVKISANPSNLKTDDNTHMPISQKTALKEAQSSLKSNSSQKIESAILQLVNTLTSNKYYSIGSLIQSITDETLKIKLEQLSEHRYSAAQQSSPVEINNHDLEKIVKFISQPRKHAGSSQIPPLYPR